MIRAILFLFFSALLMPMPASAGAVETDRVSIEAHLLPGGGPSHTAIRLVLANGTELAKLDLSGPPDFSLRDDLGNHYRRLPPPASPETVDDILPAHFPSIYPGERVEVSLAFEPPVPSARQLILELTLPLAKGAERIAVPIDIPAAATASVPRDILLVEPLPGTIASPGQSLPVRVLVAAPTLPARIIVTALAVSVEDPAPKMENAYQLRIPENQGPGALPVHVLAIWPSGETAAAQAVIDVQTLP